MFDQSLVSECSVGHIASRNSVEYLVKVTLPTLVIEYRVAHRLPRSEQLRQPVHTVCSLQTVAAVQQ